jgi:fatty-acyl-CoA synthase
MLLTASNWHEADLSSLRFCTSGGAPLPVKLVKDFEAQKGIQFKQGFGMSEFGPGVFALAAEDAIRKAGSIGRPNFFVDAKIVTDDGDELPAGEVGELVLRGPSLSSGYFNHAEASQTALDAEGWFHTGDLAKRDNEDYFYIVDRKKDLYISGGENIYPSEIESVLIQHPDVVLCAVVGVPDDQWGEVGKAFVVLQQGSTTSTDNLIAHLQHHLAGYKVPQTIEFVDSLPISAAGKVLKRDLVKTNV